jgi:hypothetical protein
MNWRHPLLQLLLLLCLGLGLVISHLYNKQWDWSQQGRNQLHPQTLALLQQLQGTLQVTAFVPDHPVQRASVSTLLNSYQQHYPRIKLKFVDPSRNPELTRRLKIHHTPQLLLKYNGKQELVDSVNEQLITQVIARLSSTAQGWIANIQGHGEASVTGNRNFDLSNFADNLKNTSYQLIDLDLSSTGQIPDNTDLLLLAAPSTSLSLDEIAIILNYLEQGGTMLWLADGKIPQALADYLGVAFLPGTIVDAAAADLGMDSPTIAVGSLSDESPLQKSLNASVLLPNARSPEIMSNKWQAQLLLKTGSRSWNETGALQGSISRDTAAGEQQGPLNLALVLSRKSDDDHLQKVVVVGDSDFLSNSFIGNGANRDFGVALIHWLAGNRQLVQLPEFVPLDQQWHWQPATMAAIASAMMFGLPLIFVLTGSVIVWRRNKA